jgi:hypothetical protein
MSELNVALSGSKPQDVLDDQVNPSGSKSSCLSQLQRNLRVGVVIAYGAGDDPSNIGTGQQIGQNAAQDIISRVPRFNGASWLTGWTGNLGPDVVELTVFFIGS